MVGLRSGPSEVRIRVTASGVNPGDVKKRDDTFGLGMMYPRVIPRQTTVFAETKWARRHIDRCTQATPASRPYR
jgi:hypothetical protein